MHKCAKFQQLYSRVHTVLIDEKWFENKTHVESILWICNPILVDVISQERFEDISLNLVQMSILIRDGRINVTVTS